MVEKKRCLATTEQMKTTIRDLQQQLREAHVDESYLRRDLTDSRRQVRRSWRCMRVLALWIFVLWCKVLQCNHGNNLLLRTELPLHC